MKRLNRYIYILHILFVSTFFSCGNSINNKNDAGKSNKTAIPIDTSILCWAEGTFENKGEAGTYAEVWKKSTEKEYLGFGYFLSKSDTILIMKMKIYKKNNLLKMNYNVKGQNDNKDVLFSLASKRLETYVFENPFKTFPSVMQYKFYGDTIIEVKESGFVNESEKKREFTLIKAKKYLLF